MSPTGGDAQSAHRAFLTVCYAGEAEAYERLWAPVIGQVSRRLLGALPLAHARCVVDVGAGTGFLLRHLQAAAPAALVVGVDLTLEMLRHARASGTAPVAGMDARQLALRTACADAVIAAFMLFHVPEPVRALAEIRRVLRPGGWCGVTVWGQRRRGAAADAVAEFFDHAGVPPDEPDSGRSDELLNTAGKLAGVLQTAGLAEVRSWSEPLDHCWDAEQLAACLTESGAGTRRLGKLPPERRQAVVERARRLVANASPDDLVDHSTVVLAVGRSR